jgi:ribosomal protein L32
MTKHSKELRLRIATQLGERVLSHQRCAYCGGTTALGRVSATVDGRKVEACWREVCFQALKAAVGGNDAQH